ncbi:hypothetical protein IWZ01DRAFT_436186 [Phyllosticta capitalensis]
MRVLHFSGILAALLGSASQVQAATCKSPLLVDDFTGWLNHQNNLQSWVADDGTMPNIAVKNRKLTFAPAANSFFYETMTCQAASNNGYSGISFSIKGPAGGSLALELQYLTSCTSTAAYKSSYYTVSGLTGDTQVVTVPWSAFSGANPNAITAFSWSAFSATGVFWEVSQIQLACSGSGSSPSSASTGSIIAASTMVTSVASSPSSAPSGQCTNVLIDDWTSQSRLTFLFYNAMLNPSSDDATMTSVVVNPGNRMTLTPKNGKSYFYSQLGCMNAKNYGGISLRIKAAAGSSFSVELDSGCGSNPTQNTLTTAQLGWTFDGTEQLYNIDFSKFSGLDLSKLQTVLFSNLKSAITLGPMQLYCGNTVAEYIPPTVSSAPAGGSTVPAPSGTAAALVIDNFSKKDTNALGFYHGADDGMTLTWGGNSLKIVSPDSDYAFYTQVSATCRDMTSYDGDYLHIAYSGSNAFTVALQQHNPTCNEQIAPYPETWDSLEAARYSTGNKDIYIPMSHFNIARGRVIGLAFKGFYTQNPTTFTKVEIVPSVPAGVTIPNKLPSGQLMFACKRPNSFAFAIDDGDPTMAQQVLNIIKEENIKVTFFTVGAPLVDPSTNLSNVYNEMMSAGHQIALHSYTHPKMEGLPSYDAIDWEYNQDIAAVQKTLNGLHTPYFRPPFGNEGARMRQRLANSVSDITDNPYIVNWSVDVEDWLWATSSTPEKQLDAFQRDVSKGGNLVVLHYLYPSTVGYLQQFIQIAKATGKQLMRVDQCMMDPNAPPL